MAYFQSNGEEDTKAIAADLAQQSSGNEVFLLEGTLGAGKSVFARAFVQKLMGAAVDVPSPTFTLVQVYDTPKGPLWHFDLYRLHEPDEIYEIGWEEALADGITLVEWPERLGPHSPQNARTIRIEIAGETPSAREIWIDEAKA